MVYLNKFIAVVKHDGRIVRDNKEGIVVLPFKAEYSVLLKNLSMQKAVVGITIDGTDVLSSNRIVIKPNSTHELYGFMDEAGCVTNKFKFIKKTEKISNHRGDRIDDGIIAIDFQYEQPIQYSYISPAPWYPPKYGGTSEWICYGSNSSGSYKAPTSRAISSTLTSASTTSDVTVMACCSAPVEEGITVKGSTVAQQYSTTYLPNLSPEHEVIIIRLQGADKPVYVNTKIECPTCGTMSKSYVKFCRECGTSLK